jgi:hypothetical protein
MRRFRVALVLGVVLGTGSLTAETIRIHQVHPAEAVKELSPACERRLRQEPASDWNASQRPRDEDRRFTANTTGGRAGVRDGEVQQKAPFSPSPGDAIRKAGDRFGRLLDQIKQPDGGFTVHAVTGRQPTTGYALSLYKGRETTKPAEDLKLVDLVRFAMANEDLLRQPDHYFGVWHNPKNNLIYMDVSRVVQSAAEAERLGRQNQQLTYFDLAEGQSIDIEKEAA